MSIAPGGDESAGAQDTELDDDLHHRPGCPDGVHSRPEPLLVIRHADPPESDVRPGARTDDDLDLPARSGMPSASGAGRPSLGPTLSWRADWNSNQRPLLPKYKGQRGSRRGDIDHFTRDSASRIKGPNVTLDLLLTAIRTADGRSCRYRHGERLGRPELLWNRLAIRFQSSDVDGDHLGRALTTLIDGSTLGLSGHRLAGWPRRPPHRSSR